jgi:hypothetical protein
MFRQKDGTYWKHKRIWIDNKIDTSNKLPQVGSLVVYATELSRKKHGVVKKYGKKTVVITTIYVPKYHTELIYEGVDIQLQLEDKRLKYTKVVGFKYIDHTPDDTIKKKWELQGSKFGPKEDFIKW